MPDSDEVWGRCVPPSTKEVFLLGTDPKVIEMCKEAGFKVHQSSQHEEERERWVEDLRNLEHSDFIIVDIRDIFIGGVTGEMGVCMGYVFARGKTIIILTRENQPVAARSTQVSYITKSLEQLRGAIGAIS
jgi:nucleoside 2-deoxyribosyltransferase